jgi:hypothetical protein
MACYGKASIFPPEPQPPCTHENPERPGVRCQRETHRKEENHCAQVDGVWMVWPGEGEAPPLCSLRASREGNERAAGEEHGRALRDEGREWRPEGNGVLLWGKR